MIISTAIIEKMKNDNQVKADLVNMTGRSYPTISKWIRENDDRLTMKVCLTVIKKRFDLEENDLFEKEEK